MKKYEELYEKRQVANMTVKVVKTMVEKFYIPFFKSMDIRDIKPGKIEDFVMRIPKDLSPRYQKCIIAILHKLFADAKRRKDISEVPDFPEIKTPEPKTTWISEEVIKTIFKQVDDQYKNIILFLWRQGVRPSEARALHLEGYRLGK